MSELTMRTSLTNLHEAEPFEGTDGFCGFQDWQESHGGLYRNSLCAHELCFQLRISILQEHLNHLAEILAQFFKGRALRMSTRKTWYVAHVELRVRAAFYYCREFSHAFTVPETFAHEYQRFSAFGFSLAARTPIFTGR